ncbi:CpsD/CapB family tyrosine-protein kinase [Rhodobacteraceae bacterium NNCM2]|nr:CpsD/CapB family tyrosine-protein kinase [Coraliihabitans acroporae]
MVERLKIAIQKAQAQRQGGTGPALAGRVRGGRVDPLRGSNQAVAAAWEALEEIQLDPEHLERNRVVSHAKSEPAYLAFDVLRTRILSAFAKHGWTRLGITSPNKSSGKTFVATNLALSLTRQQNQRAVLMDMDLRLPNVSKTFGVSQPDPAQWFLTGEVPPEDYFRRIGPNLAVGLNDKRVHDSPELLLNPTTGQSLDKMRALLAPDIEVYDLPPILACDDVMCFLPQVDCVLLVIGGGSTRADEITECERVLTDQTHLLGVLLNKAEDPDPTQYGYGYGGQGYY